MKQLQALEILKSGRNVFLTGEPGAGKTHTINLFKDWAAMHGKQIAVTASTGIAATHINGTTIHSWSGMGIKRNLNEEQAFKVSENEYVMRRLQWAQVLVIDEISMLDAQFLDDLDIVLQMALSPFERKPFGGLQVILVGDFFQLPPVELSRSNAKFAWLSKAWEKGNFTTCYLTEQHRQEDDEFLKVLTAIRTDTVEEKHKKLLRERIGQTNPYAIQLYTHNAEVDSLNSRELAKLPFEQKSYHMSSRGIDFLVKRLKDSCLSPEKLNLKENACVMFTRNAFNKDTGSPIYVNGTMGLVKGFTANHSPVIWTQGGDEIVVDRVTWSFEENGIEKAAITQYPLRLAWAITVHKSQGMSLDAAQMDLSKTFEYGQGYVALSRVRSLSGLYIKGINPKAVKVHPDVLLQDKIFRKQSEAHE